MSDYTVSICVSVYDKAALRKAAERRYVAENKNPRNAVAPAEERRRLIKEWRGIRGSHVDRTAADLIMMLDPGISPPGVQIQDTSSQEG